MVLRCVSNIEELQLFYYVYICNYIHLYALSFFLLRSWSDNGKIMQNHLNLPSNYSPLVKLLYVEIATKFKAASSTTCLKHSLSRLLLDELAVFQKEVNGVEHVPQKIL